MPVHDDPSKNQILPEPKTASADISPVRAASAENQTAENKPVSVSSSAAVSPFFSGTITNENAIEQANTFQRIAITRTQNLMAQDIDRLAQYRESSETPYKSNNTKQQVITQKQNQMLQGIKSANLEKQVKSAAEAEVKKVSPSLSMAKKLLKENQKASVFVHTANDQISTLKERSQYLYDDIRERFTIYDHQAKKYPEDGILYPDESLLQRIEISLDELHSQKNDIKKLSNAKEKKLPSKDLLAKQPSPQTVSDMYHVAKKTYNIYDQTVKPEMQKYKNTNAIFDQQFKPYSEALITAQINYERFFAQDEDTPQTKDLLTLSRSRSYEQAAAAEKTLENNQKNIKKIENLLQNDYLSKNRRDEFTKFMEAKNNLQAKAQTAKTRHQTMKKKTDSMSKENLVSALATSYHNTKHQLLDSLERYNSSDQKWKFEEDAEHGNSLISTIVFLRSAYTDTKTDLQNRITSTPSSFSWFSKKREKPSAAFENLQGELNSSDEMLNKKLAAFDHKHRKMHRAFKAMKKFNISGEKAPMIMRLVRRVKEVENAGDHGPVSSAYSGKANKLLNKMEHAEEKIQKPIDFVNEKVDDAKNIIVGSMVSSSTDDLDTMKERGEFVRGLHETANDGIDEINDAFEEAGVNFSIDMPEIPKPELSDDLQEKFDLASAIVDTIKSGYESFKELINTFKLAKGGADKREWTKQIMVLVEKVNDTFENVIGFAEDIPVLGTILSAIHSAISSAHTILDFIRSSVSSHSIKKKLNFLQARIAEKNLQYQAENKTQNGNAPAFDVYDMDSDANKKKAKQYGFSFFEEQVAAKAYAMKDTLAGRVMRFDNATEEDVKQQREAYDRERYSQKKDDGKLKKDDVAATYSENDFGNTQVSSKRYEVLLAKKQTNSEREQRKLKEKSRTLKALQDFNELSINAEAAKRMRHKKTADAESILSDALDIIGELASTFGGGAGTIAKLVLDVATTSYSLLKSGASTIRTFYRNQNKTLYSDDNKKNRRSQMAETMYDRLLVLSTMLNDDGNIDVGGKSDAEYVEIGENFRNLNEDLASNLDAFISHIIDSDSKEDMIASMSAAFSVEGN